MGQRSATETLFAIVHAFIENRSWSQTDLARRLDVGVPALRRPSSFLRQIARLPQCAARSELLRTIVARLPKGALSASFDAHAIASGKFTDAEERFLPVVEDSGTRKVALRLRYLTVSRRDEDWRRASVHRVELGPPTRFIASCHRSGTLKWFRVDNILDAGSTRTSPIAN